MSSNSNKKVFINKKAPYFKLTTWTGLNFKEVDLDDFKGKYLILKFIYKNFSEESITVIRDYNQYYDQFKNLNCDILFINIDSKHSNRVYYNYIFEKKLLNQEQQEINSLSYNKYNNSCNASPVKNKIDITHIENKKNICTDNKRSSGYKYIKYSILSDSSLQTSLDYGVLNSNADSNFNYSNKYLNFCNNATFIINPEGIVKNIQYGMAYAFECIDEIIRLVQAFQYSDKYSVVCQSRWIPGKKGINYSYRDPRLPTYWEEELISKTYI